ncbi:hypothetical protein LINPERPRIM_LOCUS34659 [Linum perenne]
MPMALRQVPAALAVLIQCFDWNVGGEGTDDDAVLIDMNERPGLTVPRAVDLMCIPKVRVSDIIISPNMI